MLQRTKVCICLFLCYMSFIQAYAQQVSYSISRTQSNRLYSPADVDHKSEVTVPVTNYIKLYAQIEDNRMVLLNWEAYTAEDFSHFIVERSKNNSEFTELGRISGNAPFRFLDEGIGSGEYFYRLTQVGKEGTILVQKEMKVKVQPFYTILLYPNPVEDVATVQLRMAVPDKVTVEVSSADGHPLILQAMNAEKGSNSLKMNVEELPMGTYWVKVFNSKNDTMDTMKMVKL